MKSLALAVALSAMLVAGPSFAQQAAAPAAPAPAQAAAQAPAILSKHANGAAPPASRP
jgi:hypothetical protein